ncbi:hypothetical protein [Neobacillus sp. PS3-40]|uniref:hypothetical protein n=1 Tax=Neobacillus sp. PS3-40 TaxID=3070679 RepID=UPI0027E1CD3D|nr:hypothetical protein [Neobacillus sp. PS3-40]WML44875.1 hypothetical protein RCG20_02920 [Neobacillus sp. PS3-40]
MKVNYPVNDTADLKEIKEALKPYGGRCAKIVEGTLEYQIKEENQSEAYEQLKGKGFIE